MRTIWCGAVLAVVVPVGQARANESPWFVGYAEADIPFTENIEREMEATVARAMEALD